MLLLSTVLLLFLHALVASVSVLPANAADVGEAEQQGRIQHSNAVNNVSILAVGDRCGPVTGASYVRPQKKHGIHVSH